MSDAARDKLRKKLRHIIARNQIVDDSDPCAVDALVDEVMVAIKVAEMSRDRPPRAVRTRRIEEAMNG